MSTDPALNDYVSGSESGGGIGNTFNFHLYNYGNNNPIRYTDPDGNSIIAAAITSGLIGAAASFVSATVTEVASRVIDGQSVKDAIGNTFSDPVSRNSIIAQTVIGGVTAAVGGGAVKAVTKASETALKQGAMTATKAIVTNTMKTVAINATAGGVDAGIKDVTTKAISGKSQDAEETFGKMVTGARDAAACTLVTEGIIGAATKSSGQITNAVYGSTTNGKLYQPKWAGSVGVFGESLTPPGIGTARDINNMESNTVYAN